MIAGILLEFEDIGFDGLEMLEGFLNETLEQIFVLQKVQIRGGGLSRFFGLWRRRLGFRLELSNRFRLRFRPRFGLRRYRLVLLFDDNGFGLRNGRRFLFD